jgi:hypothetical protein
VNSANAPNAPNLTYARTRPRITCIPERGRVTIQLTADIPLGGGQ